jgi:hypothetical protein
VEAVNCVPLPFCSVYQPPKLYPSFVAVGIFASPTEAPRFTVRDCVVSPPLKVPPSASKLTVQVADLPPPVPGFSQPANTSAVIISAAPITKLLFIFTLQKVLNNE